MAQGIFSNFFQHGYVTNDIEQAKAVFAQKCGIKSFFELEHSLPLAVPGGVEQAEIKVALAFVGDLQVELIEPLGAPGDALWREPLPSSDFAVALHHFGFMIPGPRSAWSEFRETIGNRDYPIVIEGDFDPAKFVYVDLRDSLGHYCEYLWMQDDLHAHVPRY